MKIVEVKTRIKVEEEHISKGVIGSKSECPVALAIMGTGEWSEVFVGTNKISLRGKGKDKYGLPSPASVYIPSEEVANWIWEFEQKKDVKPMEFDLKYKIVSES